VEESVARIDAHLTDVRNQLAAGLVPPSDVFTVDAQASRQRMLAVQARSNRDIVEAELARLVGAPPGTPVETAEALDALAPPPAAFDGLIEAARQQRPERAALVKRAGAAGERARAAAAGTKPTVAVSGGVDYASPNPRIFPREDAWRTSWDAGVNVSWPIFDGGRVAGGRDPAACPRDRLEPRSHRGGHRRGPQRDRSPPRARRSVCRRRRHEHRRPRRAGGAPAGRPGSHASDRKRASGGRAPRACLGQIKTCQ
jgi:hypothetical protein